MTEKLKLIIGYDGADVPTRYFVGKKEITKIEFAKEVMKRNNNRIQNEGNKNNINRSKYSQEN